MSQFSDDEIDIIRKTPLASRIGSVQRTLRSSTSKPGRSGRVNVSQGEASEEYRDTVSSLIVALLGHPVAKKLHTGDLHQPLDRELALLYARISDEHSGLNLSTFLPLTSLIERRTRDPDIDLKIWKAVVDLVSSLSREVALSKATTPPPSIPPSFGATPRTFTSASQQGSEQTKRLIEPHLREELKDCCYKNVEGFFEKYFEDKSWSSACDRIVASMMESDLVFPSMPTEAAVWDWLTQLQERYLEPELARGVYYTTRSKKDLTGSEAERQLDLLMKSREALPTDQHDWIDVRVIGEHQKSGEKGGKFLQLARYAREVFGAQPTRLFVHGFLLSGTTMEMHVFDRSGAFSAAEFDVVKESDRFIRVLVGYGLMSDEELGMDTFVERRGKRKLITLLDDDAEEQQFEVWSTPIARQSAIVSRATCCYCTVDQTAVVKFAWQSPKRVSEAEHMRAVHGINGVAQLVASGEVTTIEALRDGLTFRKKRQILGGLERTGSSRSRSLPASQSSARSSLSSKRKSPIAVGGSRKVPRSNSQVSGLSQELHVNQEADVGVGGSFSELGEMIEDTFRQRVLTWLVVSPAGRPLSQYSSVLEFLRTMRDVLKVHLALLQVRIVHRDLSSNNIVITDPNQANGYTGMLIDFDMATRIGPDGVNEGSGAGQMTGTLAFMAIEVLRSANRDIQHTYRHDLESFFYVFLSACVNYGWPKDQGPKRNPLHKWYTLPIEDIVTAKRGHMEPGGFEDIVLPKFSPEFTGLKGLARKLRNILFSTGALDISTPRDHGPLYKAMIEAFDSRITSITS